MAFIWGHYHKKNWRYLSVKQAWKSHKNIERHTAYATVLWPISKQWITFHTSDLMVIIRQCIYILSIITGEMGKLKTGSHMNCRMDNWEKCLILLTHSTKYIWQAFYKFNVFRWVCTMMIMRWCYVQTNEYDLQTKAYLHHSRNNVYAISDRIWCKKHLRRTTTENMKMGKVDTSDLIMIITWAIDISYQSHKLKWASWTHTIPYIVMTMRGNR